MPFVFGTGGVQKHIQAIQGHVPKLLRMFGIEFYSGVTISTPVDTGRARYSWNVSVDTPDFSVAAPAPAEWKGQSQGGSAYYHLDTGKAAKYFTPDKVKENSTIYISNSAPYIGRLNNGWSRQASARFVELVFENVVNKMNTFLSRK